MNYPVYVLFSEMTGAIRIRKPEIIEKCIEEANEANFDHHLDMQIMLAKKILKRVKEIERLTKPLLKMNQNMVTEIKKYQTPPEGVHHVLLATCILLGDDPNQLQVKEFIKTVIV